MKPSSKPPAASPEEPGPGWMRGLVTSRSAQRDRQAREEAARTATEAERRRLVAEQAAALSAAIAAAVTDAATAYNANARGAEAMHVSVATAQVSVRIDWFYWTAALDEHAMTVDVIELAPRGRSSRSMALRVTEEEPIAVLVNGEPHAPPAFVEVVLGAWLRAVLRVSSPAAS